MDNKVFNMNKTDRERKEFLQDCIILFEIENNRPYSSTDTDKALLQDIIDSFLSSDESIAHTVKAP